IGQTLRQIHPRLSSLPETLPGHLRRRADCREISGFSDGPSGGEDFLPKPPRPDPSVAVIGASLDRRKYGNKAVRAYVESGYTVFPVNPKETAIEGLKAYPKLDAI